MPRHLFRCNRGFKISYPSRNGNRDRSLHTAEGFSARRNLHALTLGDQRSPTQHPRSFNVSEIAYHVLDTGCACNWIPVRGISVEIALVFIETPFPNVARHIVETVIVSRIDTNSSRVSDISVVVCLVCIN